MRCLSSPWKTNKSAPRWQDARASWALSGFVSIIQTRCETRKSRSVASIFGRFFSIPANNGKYSARAHILKTKSLMRRIPITVASSILSNLVARRNWDDRVDNENQNRHHCHRIISTLIIRAKFLVVSSFGWDQFCSFWQSGFFCACRNNGCSSDHCCYLGRAKEQEPNYPLYAGEGVVTIAPAESLNFFSLRRDAQGNNRHSILGQLSKLYRLRCCCDDNGCVNDASGSGLDWIFVMRVMSCEKRVEILLATPQSNVQTWRIQCERTSCYFHC